MGFLQHICTNPQAAPLRIPEPYGWDFSEALRYLFCIAFPTTLVPAACHRTDRLAGRRVT